MDKKYAPGLQGQEMAYLEEERLVFIVTSRCNFSCKHCFRNFQNAADLPIDIAEKVILSGKKYNFKRVALTGGEPLLYPKLDQLLKLITDNNYAFSLVTNGLLFNKQYDLLNQYKKHLSFIGFSLESVNKIQHDDQRQEGSFDTLLENFNTCRKLKLPFLIVTAASLTNLDELFELAIFAKKKGALGLSMTTILPCRRLENNKLVLDASARKKLIVSVRELSKMLKFPITISADICAPGNIQLCGPLHMREVAVDMNADLVQCCELSNYDSESIRKAAVVTSLKDKSFDDGLKILSEYLHKFACRRIEAYASQKDPKHIDFNSCFYCVNPKKNNL